MKKIEIYYESVFSTVNAELRALYRVFNKLYRVHIDLNCSGSKSYISISNADTNNTIYYKTQDLPEPSEQALKSELKKVEAIFRKIEKT